MTASFRRTAVAAAVAGTFIAAVPAKADVVNFSWSGAFTFTDPTGVPYRNTPTDYAAGYYPNGGAFYGAPYFPGNIGPAADCTSNAPACITAHGWYGGRTPISGTLSFDTANGAGVGTINPFFFAGETPGSGAGTSVANFLNPTFQVVDTIGTIVGTMLLSWNGGGHSVSIVMDGSGFLANLGPMFANGATASVSGVGALPATENANFGTPKVPAYLPLGPAPIATKTLNALGCEGQPLAALANPWTIVPTGNVANCDLSQDDGVGGSPIPSSGLASYLVNLDMMSIHFDSSVQCTGCPPPPEVPVPPAVWLFGSGLLGLIGLARCKKNGRGNTLKI